MTTLAQQDGTLVQLGQVGGLGRGEQIYAVRFVGDVGYVVTFRRTDPLFTIDLSDPAAPRLRGELELLGYSAYLHPLGDGRLLGIGQSATAEGRRTGAQATLFDVSDLDAPRVTSQVDLPSGWSDVEQDHHAFLWWSPAEPGGAPRAGGRWPDRLQRGDRAAGRRARPGRGRPHLPPQLGPRLRRDQAHADPGRRPRPRSSTPAGRPRAWPRRRCRPSGAHRSRRRSADRWWWATPSTRCRRTG